MKTMTLAAQIDRMDDVIDFVNAALEAYDPPMKTMMQIDVAVEEVFANIAHYAYAPGTGEASVQVQVEGEPPCAVLRFIDGGKAFNPLVHDDPDVTLGIEDRDIGGLGIFMVKKTMDEVSYAYEDGQNVLTIRKRL